MRILICPKRGVKRYPRKYGPSTQNVRKQGDKKSSETPLGGWQTYFSLNIRLERF